MAGVAGAAATFDILAGSKIFLTFQSQNQSRKRKKKWMNSSSEPLQGSFRDPDGHVYIHDGRVFRGLRGKSAAFLEKFVETSFFKDRKNRSIVNTWKIEQAELLELGFSQDTVDRYKLWFEHENLIL